MGVYSSIPEYVTYNSSTLQEVVQTDSKFGKWRGILKNLEFPRTIVIPAEGDILEKIKCLLSQCETLQSHQDAKIVITWETESWYKEVNADGTLEYRVAKCALATSILHILVIHGKESRTIRNETDALPYTLFPCIESFSRQPLEHPDDGRNIIYDVIGRCRNGEREKSAMDQAFKNGDSECDMRTLVQVLKDGDNESNTNKKETEGKIIRISNGLENVHLNHYLIFQSDENLSTVYWTQLPTRRYLSGVKEYNDYVKKCDNRGEQPPDEYNNYAEKCDNPKKVDESCYASATCLFSFETLCNIFKNYNLIVPAKKGKDVFFHNCLTSLYGLSYVSTAKRESQKESLSSAFKELCANRHYQNPSTERDEWFNSLSVETRCQLLGLLNVHDVLIVTRPCPQHPQSSSQGKRRRGNS